MRILAPMLVICVTVGCGAPAPTAEVAGGVSSVEGPAVGTRGMVASAHPLATESVDLSFTPDAIQKIAEISEVVNEQTENIGARRLQTVMERLLEDISFDAPELGGSEVVIDAARVEEVLGDIVGDKDLSRYIL